MFANSFVRHTIRKGKQIKRYLSSRFGVDNYLKKANILIENKKDKDAINILRKGLKFFPRNFKLNKLLADIHVKNEQLEEVIALWEKYYKLQREEMPDKVFLQLSIAYKTMKRLEDSEGILQKGIKQNQNSLSLWSAYAFLACSKYDWYVAIQRLQRVCEIYDFKKKKVPFDIHFKLAASYQIVGEYIKANTIYDSILRNFSGDINSDNQGYRKIVLFDNGESRIEFYKSLKHIKKVVITFDSINMTWDKPSFAFKLLIKQNVDIIAIRKRKSRTYQQDLSLDNFVQTINQLISGYSDPIAYGFSLGAYSSLYYASHLKCRILALAPRLSIHPVYGRENLKGRIAFKHEILPKYNEEISPIIVFDPKNELDNTYVKDGLLSTFPNADLVQIPYVGHRIAPYLLEVGLLKEFILMFIKTGETPLHKKELRRKSFSYYRELGNACLKRNKPVWAYHLVIKALEMSPKDNLSNKLKIKVLKSLEQSKETIQFAGESIRKSVE